MKEMYVLFPQASKPSLNFNISKLLIGAKLHLVSFLYLSFFKSPYDSLYLKSGNFTSQLRLTRKIALRF